MTAFALKLFAMILMFGDHLYSFVPNQPLILNLLGRLVAPIFVFFMVEGFFYTRSRFNYAKRLAIGGATMLIGNKLIQTFLGSETRIHNNVFLSLFTAFCMIWAIETGRKSISKKKGLAIAMFLIALVFGVLTLFTEGSIFTLSAALAFYFSRNSKVARIIAYTATTFIITIGINLPMYIADPIALTYDIQWFSIFAIIPIALYNGKRGLNNKFSKNLFYYFYPIHIWILYTIGTFLI